MGRLGDFGPDDELPVPDLPLGDHLVSVEFILKLYPAILEALDVSDYDTFLVAGESYFLIIVILASNERHQDGKAQQGFEESHGEGFFIRSFMKSKLVNNFNKSIPA